MKVRSKAPTARPAYDPPVPYTPQEHAERTLCRSFSGSGWRAGL